MTEKKKGIPRGSGRQPYIMHATANRRGLLDTRPARGGEKRRIVRRKSRPWQTSPRYDRRPTLGRQGGPLGNRAKDSRPASASVGASKTRSRTFRYRYRFTPACHPTRNCTHSESLPSRHYRPDQHYDTQYIHDGVPDMVRRHRAPNNKRGKFQRGCPSQ